MSQYAVIIRIKEFKRQLRAQYNPETLCELYRMIDLLEEPNAKKQEAGPASDGAADRPKPPDATFLEEYHL